MIKGLASALNRLHRPHASANPARQTTSAAALADMMDQVFARDPYLCLADRDRKLISVFDDLRYDRADADMLCGPMRRRIVERLAQLGFRQISGHVIEHKDADVRALIPKFRALGESPFDALREINRRPQDYCVLTPTQSACQIIDTYPTAEAQGRLLELIVQQPINIYRIHDYMRRSDQHVAFKPVLGHLKFVQREAIRSEPLKTRRALR